MQFVILKQAKALRLSRACGLVEAATRAGISHNTLSRLESGQPCSIATVRRVIEALKLMPAFTVEPDLEILPAEEVQATVAAGGQR